MLRLHHPRRCQGDAKTMPRGRKGMKVNRKFLFVNQAIHGWIALTI